MTQPIWLPIPSHPGYFASDDGLIQGPYKLRKTRTDKDGYVRIGVSIAGKHYTRLVHRLVCEAFHGPCPASHEVRHLNGVRADNRAVNLAWGTRSQNRQDTITHGTNPWSNKTHCPQGHEYTPENIQRRKNRRGRECKKCNRARVMAYTSSK